MKTTGRVLTGLCLLLVIGGCATRSTEGDEKAIRELLAHIQQSFNSRDLDAFMPVFAEDAVMTSQGFPDVTGPAAIRAVYEGALAQMDMQVQFQTEELNVFGDLAYERGTYTIAMKDKATGQNLPVVHNRHIHIFRKQPDGQWRTWRMMTNSAAATPGPG